MLFGVMKLKEWRSTQTHTLADVAEKIGISGRNPSRTLQRYEDGSQWPDAPLLDAIIALTNEQVTLQDMHDTRLEWLAAHRRVEAC